MQVLEISDITNRTLKNFFDDPNLQVFERHFALRKDGKSEEYELCLRTSSGRLVPIFVVSMPIYNEKGKFIGSIGIIKDLEMEKSVQQIDLHIEKFNTAEEILVATAEEIKKLVQFDLLTVTVYDRGLNWARILVSYPKEASPNWPKRWFQIETSVRQWASDATVKSESVESLLTRVSGSDQLVVHDLRKRGLKSFIRYPVVRGGEMVAALNLFSKKENAFLELQNKFVGLPLSKAILTALYFEDRAELDFRLKLITSLAKCETNKDLARLIVDRICAHYKWASVTIFRVDDAKKIFYVETQAAIRPGLRLKEGHTQKWNEGMLGECFHQKCDQNIGDVRKSASYMRDIFQDSQEAQKIKSAMCFRIMVGGRVWGLLDIEDVYEHAFSDGEFANIRELVDEVAELVARRHADNLMNALFAQTPYGIFVTTLDGKIQQVNKAAENLLGLTPQQIVGRKVSDFCRDREIGLQVDETPEPKAVEIVLLDAKQREVPVVLEGRELGNDIGRRLITCKSIILENQEQRIKDLAAIFYEIAAQTRTPLSLAFKWAKDVRNELSQQEKSRSLIDIFGQTKRLGGWVNTLSGVAQQLVKVDTVIRRLALYDDPHKLAFEPIVLSFPRLLQSVIDELPQVESEHIERCVEINEDKIQGDPYQLGFILRTLLSYFIRLRSGDRKVKIKASNRDTFLVVSVEGPYPGKNIERQRDTGHDPVLAEVKTEIQLGERIIRAFVGNHPGATFSDISFGDKNMQCELSFVCHKGKQFTQAPEVLR
jgi:PAS domain-containing protein